MATAQRIDIQTFTIGGHSITLLDCATCGEVFGMSAATVELRRRDGVGFTCPNGHSNAFARGESLQQRELEEAQRRAKVAEHDAAEQRRLREWAERSAKGANISAGIARAASRRLLHRVNCGVCPHCRRTFKQLAAHIKTKHAGK